MQSARVTGPDSSKQRPDQGASVARQTAAPDSNLSLANPRSLLGLQGRAGNQATARMLARRAEGQRLKPPAPKGHARGTGFALPAGVTRAFPAISRQAAGHTCIQRHSAYEHYLLGQVAPSNLASIPAVREIPALQKQLADLEKQAKKSKAKKDKDAVNALADQIADLQGKKEDVRHTIEQEMDRLYQWRNNPEAAQMAEGELGKPTKGKDDTWNVPLVSIPCADGSVTVAYSEINTLPDLFGNPEAIAKTPKAKVLGLLQGVRQQAYIELDNLYVELFKKSRNKLHNRILPDDDFQGARGPRAQAVIDKAYEIRMESQVNSDTTRKGEESDAYFAALERNACHFFPENKKQWQGYHEQARDLAEEAADARMVADAFRDAGDSESAATWDQKAAEFGNKALLQNAFGEHYLQDAYAGGHLVNKTAIMQWFVQWLDSKGGLGTTDFGQSQFAMAKYAANQKLESNPQRLDDRIKRGELGSFAEGSKEVGMQSTPEIVMMMKWRHMAADRGILAYMTPRLAARRGLAPDAKTAAAQLRALRDQGFAEDFFDDLTLRHYIRLRSSIIDTAPGRTGGLYNASQDTVDEEGNPDFAAQAEEFNLAAYNQFLSNAYIQGATKFFHDKYCKEGLDVVADNGDRIYTVYGDANMLKAGGQVGVLYSATTSKKSREAIFEIINGDHKKAATVDEILGRFPAHVVDKDGKQMTLEGWNDQLHQQGLDGLFAKARDYGAKILSKAKGSGSISGGHAIDLEMLGKQVAAQEKAPEHDAVF